MSEHNTVVLVDGLKEALVHIKFIESLQEVLIKLQFGDVKVFRQQL